LQFSENNWGALAVLVVTMMDWDLAELAGNFFGNIAAM
jgi:hypothetical protein